MVEKNRKNEAAQGKMRPVQKTQIIEGPVAHTSNRSLQRPPPIPKEKFKPRMNKQGDEYYQQIVFKDGALDQVGKLESKRTW